MEKVQVISVKPICSAGNEEKLYTSCPLESNSANCEIEKPENVNLSRQKNSSFAFRGPSLPQASINLNGNAQGFKKNNYNSSFKHAVSKSSQKEKGAVDEKFHQSKSGFSFPAASTNCFGRSDFRASYNERIRSGPTSLQHFTGYKKEKKVELEAGEDFVYLTGKAVVGSGLYKSNSSLELDQDSVETSNVGNNYLKREYGSHGSINVAAVVHQESLYSVLQSYQQDSKKSDEGQLTDTSPKVLSKIHRLWEKDKSSIFKKFLPSKSIDTGTKSDKADDKSEISSNFGGTVISNSNAKQSTELMESDNKEDMSATKPMRRSAIAHYDCQSLASQLSPSRLKSLLADRSNTTTGASAASMADSSSSLQNAATHSSAEELNVEDNDQNGSSSNHLVSSCPFFENEIGGEGERIVSLSREVTRPMRNLGNLKATNLHRSASASSIGLLEPVAGSSFWCQTLCPYVKKSPILEKVDQGSSFYTTYFRSQEHQNWFGVDELLGPVAISIKKEKVEDSALDKNHSLPSYQFRFIFRTSELYTCQGTIREEILNTRGDKGKSHGYREGIEYLCPQLNVNCLRLGSASVETEEELLKLDELGIHANFKVGVLYCRAGQKTEEDMYNNENSGPAFSEFLEILGQRVRLKNFDKYRGGLDKNTDSTGHYSVYTQFQDYEIMFHVSTLLPFTPTNKKQLLRKRHIGNDIVTIIFQEPGALPFTPKCIRSHFQHVFIIVQAINPCTESTQYSVAVSRFQDVPMFGPPIPEHASFPKSKKFVDFLLAKVINGELAVLRSEKFACMAARTKHEYLKDLAVKRITSTTLDTSSKFSLIGFSRASKKEKSRFKYVADSTVKGALSWNMIIYDATLQQNVDCVLGISVDSLVVLEVSSSSITFSASCRSILGWTTKPKQGLHIFYHQGECLIFNLSQGLSDTEGEELLNDVVARLSAVTQGAESQELILKRNPSGLLGFNVQQDGIITEVEPYGLAAQARLQQGSRLVEICTVALSTLSQEQMVDLLKTSMTVTVTVIPPHADGTPRRGCNVPTCTFLLGCSEGDYENLTPPEQGSSVAHTKNRLKQLNRCDRSLSPTRSGSSSGYGTGSSSHSFSMEQSSKIHAVIQEANFCSQESISTKDKFSYSSGLVESSTQKFNDYTGTLSSTSSGHSTDRWSETNADEASFSKPVNNNSQFNSNPVYQRQQSPYPQSEKEYSPPPPPLPARLYQQKGDAAMTYNMPGGNFEHSSDGKGSSYGRRWLHPPFGSQATNYEQNNYAVPKAIPRPVARDGIESNQKANRATDGNYYDNARYSSSRAEMAFGGGSSNLKSNSSSSNLRRNSSPLALESKDLSLVQDLPEEVKRRDGQLKAARHSIPKSSEDRSLQEHLPGCRSEDELSGSSGSSPHGFQQKTRGGGGGCGGSNSSPSLSSRTQSPHNPNPAVGTSQTVRLKHSVQNSKNAHHRNSASIGSTNLQEELLKLINPDYLSDSESMGAEIREQQESNIHKINAFPTYDVEEAGARHATRGKIYPNSCEPNNNANINANTGIYECLPVPYQTIGEAEFTSRKNVFARTNEDGTPVEGNSSTRKPQSNEGLLLTARPATVISNSSTASSPAYFEGREKQSSSEVVLEPRRTGTEIVLEPRRSKETLVTSTLSQSGIVKSGVDTLRDTVGGSDSFVGGGGGPQISVSSVIDEEWSSLVNTATLAIEKSENSSPDIRDMNANPSPHLQQFPKTHSPHLQQPTITHSPLSLDVVNSLPEEIHKYIPIYYEYLKDSKSGVSRPQSCNENLDHSEDSNGNNSLSSVASSIAASLPPSADEGTRQLVQQLERALVSEQQLSGKLKEEVTFLRNENSKLLKDSRAAAQQLHQFTEWFFKNIHKS